MWTKMRHQWEKRAGKLIGPYKVGRTDMFSYVEKGRRWQYVHYAYPPYGFRIPFYGHPAFALRGAVKYAEKYNKKHRRNKKIK